MNMTGVKHDIGLGDLIEGIVLHSFEGKHPFGEESRKFIEQMRQAYGLDLCAEDSHALTEGAPESCHLQGAAFEEASFRRLPLTS